MRFTLLKNQLIHLLDSNFSFITKYNFHIFRNLEKKPHELDESHKKQKVFRCCLWNW